MNKQEVSIVCHKCKLRDLRYSRKIKEASTFCLQANNFHYELSHCPFIDELKTKK